jgi:hypothetical protein
MTEVIFEEKSISIEEACPVFNSRYQVHIIIISLEELLLETVWCEKINHAH